MSAETHADDKPPRRTGRPLTWAVVVVVVLWAPIILFWGDAPFTITFDDAYYYFEIARNIAAGEGSTFDTINQTNGYHPLWLAVSVIPYAVGLDGLGAVRALLLAQLAGWAVTLILVGRIVTGAIDGWPRLADRDDTVSSGRRSTLTVATLLVLFAANPFVIKMFVNGLESGLGALVQAAILLMVWRQGGNWITGNDRYHRLALGGLLALAFLARTDAVVLIGVVGLWTLAEARSVGRGAVLALVELFVVPTVTMAAYFTTNQLVFGSYQQVSGEVKRLPLTTGRAATFVGFAVLAGVVAWRARRHVNRRDPRRGRFVRTRYWLGATGWYGAFCILLVGYYASLSAQQWLWYYAPLALYALILLLLAGADFCESALVEARPGQSSARTLAPLQAILIGTLAAGMAWQLSQFLDPEVRSIQIANRDAGLWISENLDDEAVLGSWDAGVVGYFTDQPVINLDGVVNSYEWVEATSNGTTDVFLRDRGLDHIVNLGRNVDGDDPDIPNAVTTLLGPETADGLEQVTRFEFVYSGRIEGAGQFDGAAFAVFIYRVPPP